MVTGKWGTLHFSIQRYSSIGTDSILRALPAWRKLALAAQMQEQTDTIILHAIQ